MSTEAEGDSGMIDAKDYSTRKPSIAFEGIRNEKEEERTRRNHVCGTGSKKW